MRQYGRGGGGWFRLHPTMRTYFQREFRGISTDLDSTKNPYWKLSQPALFGKLNAHRSYAIGNTLLAAPQFPLLWWSP
jgi:hypothetical protein